jgi:hypothetical protein
MSFNPGENFQLRPWQRMPEMLASEVTPGLQQEQSPMPISLCHDLFIKEVIKWKLTQNNIVLTPKLGQVCMSG